MDISKIQEPIWDDEFKNDSSSDNRKYNAVFDKYHLPLGRMMSWSKSDYRHSYPKNLVVFNGNIVTEKTGKVWFGDLDITRSMEDLQKVADELQENLYVLKEMDCRFENENKPFSFYKNKAVIIIKFK